MKLLIISLILTVVVFGICPNNCSSHGKCEGGSVCRCFKKSDGYDNDYVGADCSKRGCGSGKSFSCLNTNDKYDSRSVDDGNFIYGRALGENREMVESEVVLSEITSKEKSEVDNIYKIKSDKKIVYYNDEVGYAGMMNCYNSNGAFVGSSEIIKVIKESEYYMKDEKNIINVGMRCLLVMKYSDLSLINPTKVETKTEDSTTTSTVTWKGMSKIFSEIKDSTSPGLNMGCTSEIGKELSSTATTISTIEIKDGGDIVFTLQSEQTGVCVLLAKIKEEDKTVAAVDVNECDYNKYYPTIETSSAVESNMYGVSHNSIYTIPINNIQNNYGDSSFGLLNCRIPGNRDIHTAYLLGKTSGSYYIIYDFDIVDVDGKKSDKLIPILYYCKLNQYEDFSLYYPVELPTTDTENDCSSKDKCKITWKNMCNSFSSYLPSADDEKVQFACRNNKNEVELYEYNTPTTDSPCTANSDVVFTLVSDKLPKDRICNLIAGNIDSKVKTIDISESVFYKNHLTKKESTTNYNYYSSLPTSEVVVAPIYKVNGLNIISLASGGIMRCYDYKNGKINTNVEDVNLLYKNGNDYYVQTETDIKGKTCDLLYSHKDMTLYPSSKVNSGDNTVEFSAMSYYFQLLGFFKLHEESKKYTMLCGTLPADQTPTTFTEYEFTLKTELKLPYYESTSDNVVFTYGDSSLADKTCFLLSSFDGSKISVDQSDLTNQYKIEKDGSNWKLTSKKPTATDIYKITGVKYEGIELYSGGGLLECRNKNNNKPLGLAKIYSYYKDGEIPTYAIKYYFLDTNVVPTPESYNCKVIEIYNDLTLYLPPQKCSDGVITWSNMKEIFPNIYKEYDPAGKEVKMLCEDEKDNEYKVYPAKATSDDDSGSNNIKFTITPSPAPDGKKCFLMSNADGRSIASLSETQKSDLGKMYDISQKGEIFTLKLKSTIPIGKKSAKTGIYELSNVNYDVGSELSCLTYDSSNEISNGLILKKENNK